MACVCGVSASPDPSGMPLYVLYIISIGHKRVATSAVHTLVEAQPSTYSLAAYIVTHLQKLTNFTKRTKYYHDNYVTQDGGIISFYL